MSDVLRANLSKMLMSWANYFAQLAMKYFADWVLRKILGLLGFDGGSMGSAGMPMNFFPAAPGGGASGPHPFYARGGAFVTSGAEYFGFQKEHNVGVRGEVNEEGVFPLARNSRGQLGVVAMLDDSQKGSGGTMQYTSSNVFDFSGSNMSEEQQMLMMQRMEERQREAALLVIAEEKRVGGLLYNG